MCGQRLFSESARISDNNKGGWLLVLEITKLSRGTWVTMSADLEGTEVRKPVRVENSRPWSATLLRKTEVIALVLACT